MKIYNISDLIRELTKILNDEGNYSIRVNCGNTQCDYLEIEPDDDVYLDINAYTEKEADEFFDGIAEDIYIDNCTRNFEDKEYMRRHHIYEENRNYDY